MTFNGVSNDVPKFQMRLKLNMQSEKKIKKLNCAEQTLLYYSLTSNLPLQNRSRCLQTSVTSEHKIAGTCG